MSEVLFEDQLSQSALLSSVHKIYSQRAEIAARLATFEVRDSVAVLTGLISQAAGEAVS